MPRAGFPSPQTGLGRPELMGDSVSHTLDEIRGKGRLLGALLPTWDPEDAKSQNCMHRFKYISQMWVFRILAPWTMTMTSDLKCHQHFKEKGSFLSKDRVLGSKADIILSLALDSKGVR